MLTDKPASVDAYIAQFPEEVQARLQKIRATIRAAAPDAEEVISYGMPTFRQHGNLVYFAAYKNHIGFYGTPSGHEAFEKELSMYKSGKGSVQFPLDQPVPYEVIGEITKFRVENNLKKYAAKKKK